MDTIAAIINHPVINHPLTPIATTGGLVAATPTLTTFDLILKVIGMAIAIAPALKQLFRKKQN